VRRIYEIVLPDGRALLRRSELLLTHAVIAQRTSGWKLVALCESLALAEKRIDDLPRTPNKPVQVVPVRVVVPLTERQRQFLVEIGDRTVEIHGTAHLVALVRRGLVERSFIGMRWWRVRRTAAGRQAVEASP
jgi:hypothetical protein